jgi:RNA polymerase sigma-70 factor (ECF subfamily)
MASATAVALKRKKAKVYDSPEELILVHRAKKGDEAAFTALYSHHLNRVRVTINRIVKDEDLSDWLANVTLTKVWQKLSSFDEQSKFSTWITRIAINEGLMHIRHAKCMSRAAETVSLDALLNGRQDGKNAPSDHAAANGKVLAVRDLDLEGIADRQVLETAIRRVPVRFRQILRLRFWDGHTVEEIRQILSLGAVKEVTIPAVKTRLLRGRLILMEQVQQISS